VLSNAIFSVWYFEAAASFYTRHSTFASLRNASHPEASLRIAMASVDPIETYLEVNESIHSLQRRGLLLGRLYNFLGIYEESMAQYCPEGYSSESSTEDSKEDDGWGIPLVEIERAFVLGQRLVSLREKFVHSVGGAVRIEPGHCLALVIGGRVLELSGRGLVKASDVLPHCTPAGFGDLRARATMLDESVRRASECRSPAFELVQLVQGSGGKTSSFSGSCAPPSFLEDIAEAITVGLLPRGFCLRPHKLNVYGPGGHFAPHVDTPTDPRMAGSLVVSLPCAFDGGELVVADDAGARASYSSFVGGPGGGRIEGTEYAWGHGKRTDPGLLHWAAFFGDVAHEVRVVTDGYRITVTYAIVCEDSPVRACVQKHWQRALAYPGRAPATQAVVAAGFKKAAGKKAPAAVAAAAAGSSDSVVGDTPYDGLVVPPGSSPAALLSSVHAALEVLAPTSASPVGIILSHAYTLLSAANPGALLGCDAALFASMAPRYGTCLVPVVFRRYMLQPGYAFLCLGLWRVTMRGLTAMVVEFAYRFSARFIFCSVMNYDLFEEGGTRRSARRAGAQQHDIYAATQSHLVWARSGKGRDKPPTKAPAQVRDGRGYLRSQQTCSQSRPWQAGCVLYRALPLLVLPCLCRCALCGLEDNARHGTTQEARAACLEAARRNTLATSTTAVQRRSSTSASPSSCGQQQHYRMLQKAQMPMQREGQWGVLKLRSIDRPRSRPLRAGHAQSQASESALSRP
jgi:hypothetical protein